MRTFRKYAMTAIFMIAGVVCFHAAGAFAQGLPPGYTLRGTARPERYSVSMQKFEVSQDNGTTIIIIKNTTSAFDIASATAGATVGSWFSGLQLEPGTYNWSRRTVSSTFNMKGYVTYNTNTYYTSSSSIDGPNINHVAAGSFDPNSPPADYTAVDINVSGPSGGSDLVDTDTTHPMTIAAGGSTTITLTFDTNNTLRLAQDGGGTYYFFPSPPSVTIAIT